MPKIRIDEREIEVGERENLIDAAARAGVHIPHFCYHPALSVAGNCRQCLVEVEGVPKPQIACNTPVKAGMVIRTTSPGLQEARRGVLEYLLLNHPIDCPICDQAGECRLQEYYMSHGLYDSRRNVDKVHKPKMVDLGPLVLLDTERCVLCTRCVRFCQEVAGTEELYVKERGHRTEIATFPGQPLQNAYSGNVVDICPVGALLNKDFRFKSRVWWLKKADSLCTSCARGCNVRIDHHWNQVQRLVPRYNPEVNQYWMCDRGRRHYRWINDARLTEAQIGSQGVSLREALEALGARLRELQGDVAVLLSPKLANEDLLVLRRLFADVYPVQRLGAGSLEPPQPEDRLLRRADPHPNSFAVRALGLAADVHDVVRGSGARALLVFGDDPVGWDEALATAFASYELVAAALSNQNATSAAVLGRGGILLPLATHAEYAGSFTNFEGRVQRFAPALALYGSALPGYALGLELARVLRRPFWPQVGSPARSGAGEIVAAAERGSQGASDSTAVASARAAADSRGAASSRAAASFPSPTPGESTAALGSEGPANPGQVLAAIWEQLVPAGCELARLAWERVEPYGLVAGWRRTARPRSVLVGDDEPDAGSWTPERSGAMGTEGHA